VQRPSLNRVKAQLLSAAGDPAAADTCRETAYGEATLFNALGEVRQIALDGFKSTSGRRQIESQRRYHEVL
jgi:hypothetical protein